MAKRMDYWRRFEGIMDLMVDLVDLDTRRARELGKNARRIEARLILLRWALEDIMAGDRSAGLGKMITLGGSLEWKKRRIMHACFQNLLLEMYQLKKRKSEAALKRLVAAVLVLEGWKGEKRRPVKKGGGR